MEKSLLITIKMYIRNLLTCFGQNGQSLGNFWYSLLPAYGLFQPKHVVSEFLIYIINIHSW